MEKNEETLLITKKFLIELRNSNQFANSRHLSFSRKTSEKNLILSLKHIIERSNTHTHTNTQKKKKKKKKKKKENVA